MSASPSAKPKAAVAAPWTREALGELVRVHPESLVELVLALQAQVTSLSARQAELTVQVEELRVRLAGNSRNSHRPPGSDGPGKPPAPAPKSLRQKGARSPGGQPGHRGRTLVPVAVPDAVVPHALGRCPCGLCGGVPLAPEPLLGHVARQVWELPPVRLVVTEHRAERKVCPVSGREVCAPFPAGVAAPVQYGEGLRALAVYLHHGQLLPVARVASLCEDLFGAPVSPATVARACAQAAGALEGWERQLQDALAAAPVVHLDESGLRVGGHGEWVHVASTPKLTLYGVHPQRGREAMEAAGVVPRLAGWAVHDCWAPYFTYENCAHALCGQHLLRELRMVEEELGEGWAGAMGALLREGCARVHREDPLSEGEVRGWEVRYRRVLDQGRRLHPRPPPGSPRVRQSRGAALLGRLEDYDACVLAFLADPLVPFTNNQAEQDIRMVKVKAKVSGGFRTREGASVFARVRSFLSTARKQGRGLLESLTQLFQGQPFDPALAA